MGAVASIDILKDGLIVMEMSKPNCEKNIQKKVMSNEARIYYQELQRDYSIFC